MPTLKNITTGFSILAFMLVLNACVVPSGPHGHYPPSYSHSAMVYWDYYPNYQVYYHPTDHYYYYSIGGVWRRSTSLPSGWVLRDEPHVRLEVTGVPHHHHSNHRRLYPPRRPVTVVPGRPGNGDQHRPDRDDRHGSGNSPQHRPDMDRKEGRNIFVPHTKGKSVYEKRQNLEKYDQTNKSDYKKGENSKYYKNRNQAAPVSNTKSQGKTQIQQQKHTSNGKGTPEKSYRKDKAADDDEDNGKQSRGQNYKEKDSRREYKER